MELTALNIQEGKINQFNRAGIMTLEDLMAYYPAKYQDYSKLTKLHDGAESVFLFACERVKFINSRINVIKAMGKEVSTGTPVYILWFNQSFLYQGDPKNKGLKDYEGDTVLVAGKTVFTQADGTGPDRYEVNSPALFDGAGMEALCIKPVYKKVPGMADAFLKNCIYDAGELLGAPAETLPEKILRDAGVVSHADMVAGLHWPMDADDLQAALTRKRWDDLLYFALRIDLSYRSAAIGSPFSLPLKRLTTTIQEGLPFRLTQDQATTLEEIHNWISAGKRINALIQGDVGCGKTIIALLLMVAFAENGYQAVLMAPTQILAQQHYEDLVKLVEPYGLKVAFVSGQRLRKAEQIALQDSIASGEVKLIVGTQALLSDTYQFDKLALVIEDEEHKYGVVQRQTLTEKAALGTHMITMSATPIPRSLAQTIYGDNLQLYSIHTKPAGRQPVRTGMMKTMQQLYAFLAKDITERGHQAYVVCPMIAPNEKVEGVATAEETFKDYKKALGSKGISIGLVTGKTKKEEAAQIRQDFKDNKISVLVSTTVIEVGINVPNATCIVIHNAERFGLAQLHQLRGRVGRGAGESWCVLVSEEKDNPRLAAMCKYTDGFDIAEMDLSLRGAGDLLGVQQSGSERFLALALQYNEEYKKAQAVAKWMLDTNAQCPLLDKVLADHRENVGGEMVVD